MKNTDETSLNLKKLNEVFDVTLRSLRSKNARLVFKILYDQRELELTTLDMQNFLKEYNVKLTKKDLHNWLINLMYSGLIIKSKKRGKPTTIPYQDRYSFDLWKITEKGEEIAQKMKIFLEEYPNLIEEKIIIKKIIPSLGDITLGDFEMLSNIFYTTKILMGLYKSSERIDSEVLSNLTKINHQVLIDKLVDHMKNREENLYQIREKKANLPEKILSILGYKPRKLYWVSITEKGKNVVRNMLS